MDGMLWTGTAETSFDEDAMKARRRRRRKSGAKRRRKSKRTSRRCYVKRVKGGKTMLFCPGKRPRFITAAKAKRYPRR